jgi:uncharacterized protein YcgI (DUF1989 family)
MPLTMIERSTAALPAEQDVLVEAGRAGTLVVRQGQMLAIEVPDGAQVAALFAWTIADPSEWLSPHHTRVFGGTFVLRMGTRLVTNRRRPIFVVGRDSLRRHDLLLPASDDAIEAVGAALVDAKFDPPRIADPVNLFAAASLDPDGRIEVQPSPARPGERWTARVLIDSVVAVTATVIGSYGLPADGPRPIRVRVLNDVRDIPPDLPTWVDEAGPRSSER